VNTALTDLKNDLVPAIISTIDAKISAWFAISIGTTGFGVATTTNPSIVEFMTPYVTFTVSIMGGLASLAIFVVSILNAVKIFLEIRKMRKLEKLKEKDKDDG